jgi:hypothetical protein
MADAGGSRSSRKATPAPTNAALASHAGAVILIQADVAAIMKSAPAGVESPERIGA